MYKLSLAILIAASIVLSGCGGGGGKTSTTPTDPNIPPGPTPPTPPTTPAVVISGTVVASNNNHGVGGVVVEFGQPPYGPLRTTTASSGVFSFTLPTGRTAADLYPTSTKTFRVDSTFAGEAFPSFLPVNYYGQSYDQGSIKLTDSQQGVNVLAGLSTNLGTVTITYYDPSTPPAPPSFP